MNYNPNIHHRRSIRLKGYDYSKAGLYFITICVQDRKCLFGKIVGAGFTPARFTPARFTPARFTPARFTPARFTPARFTPALNDTDAQNDSNVQMELNEFGKIAYNHWEKLSERFSNFELDVFQIMPNHMHGIILLNELARPDKRAGASPAPTTTIGDIVGAYKSLVANECLVQFKLNRPNEMMGKLWQRNFHEHIIRDEQSYQRIADYIINNPAKWKDDKFYNQS